MSIGFVTIILIVLAAIAARAVIMGVVLTVAGRTDEPSRGARRRIQILYGTAALVGISFALLVVYAFPTVYVNSTEVPGLLAALGPSLAGILLVDVPAHGESFWRKPKGEQRGAYLTRRPALDISAIWDRPENPEAGSDGVAPEQNDFRLTLSLGMKF